MDIGPILGLVVALIGFGVFGIAAGEGAGQGADAGAGSPPPPGTGGAEDAGSPPAGSGAPPPGAGPESANIRQLRDAYEALKREHEPYSKLGKPEELQAHVSIAQRITTAAVEAGTALGYDEAEVREAMVNDPDGTLAFLRRKQAEAERDGARPDVKQLLKKELDTRLKPFEEREETRLNEEARGRFDTTFEKTALGVFKDDWGAIAREEKAALYDIAVNLFLQDEKAWNELRTEGKTAGVAAFFDKARGFLDKYYVARSQREQKRVNPGGQPPGERPGKTKASLDDMIQDAKNINPRYV